MEKILIADNSKIEYVMQLWANITNSTNYKEAERELESVPIAELIPILVIIIENTCQNPEVEKDYQQKILAQSAAINLKNTINQKYKAKVTDYFKDTDRALELLKKVEEIFIYSDNPLVAPHLGLTILAILKGISAKGPLIVETVNEIYKKVTEKSGNLFHQKLAIEAIYEVLSEYTKMFEVFEEITKLEYLWKDNFDSWAKALLEVMKNREWTKDSLLIKEIFILMSKILLKVFKILEKDTCYKITEYIKSLKEVIFKIALDSSENIDWENKQKDLEIIQTIQRLEIYCIEFIALEKKDLNAYLGIADYYLNVSFSTETLEIMKTKFLLEPNYSSIEDDSYELATILNQGIKFHK